MEKKMTQKEMFNEVIALAEANDRQDIVDFAKGRIEALDKKASSKGKQNEKKSAEQNEVKTAILNVLAKCGKRMTATEILNGGDFKSVQQVSAMLKKMVDDDATVIKTVEKKVSYFSLPTDEVEEVEPEKA